MISMTLYDNINNQEIIYYLNGEGLVVGLEVFFFSPKDPAEIVSTALQSIQAQQPITRARHSITPPHLPSVYNPIPLNEFNMSQGKIIESPVANIPVDIERAPVYKSVKVGNPRKMRRGCC